MVIDFVTEFEITEKAKAEIASLLALCFSQTAYNGRTFFKQLPHYRLLLNKEGNIIGQVALDYRIMNLGGCMVSVFGIIDLAIHPDYQGQGLGTELMKEVDKISKAHKHNIDFLFLVTGKPHFYERLGYIVTQPKVTWLKINKGQNYGLATEIVTDCTLMYKKVSGKDWADGDLDMLGYWY
jgi:predicted N-acetyltransferase YhbS